MVAASLQCRSSSTQHERRLRAEGVERLDQLPQHPLARRPLRPPLHRLEIVVAQQRRQLREPRRRVLLQDANERFAPGSRPIRPSASSTGR